MFGGGGGGGGGHGGCYLHVELPELWLHVECPRIAELAKQAQVQNQRSVKHHTFTSFVSLFADKVPFIANKRPMDLDAQVKLVLFHVQNCY